MYSKVLLLLAAVAALAVGVSAAPAAAPGHMVQHYETDFVWPAGSVCSFAVLGHSVYDGRETSFTDNTYIRHNQMEETLTNVTTTHQISISESYSAKVDYTTYVAHDAGLLLKVRDGEGKLLFVQSGLHVEAEDSVLKTTPHTLIDRDLLCNALGR